MVRFGEKDTISCVYFLTIILTGLVLDHIAVALFFIEEEANLTLHLPCGWDRAKEQFVDLVEYLALYIYIRGILILGEHNRYIALSDNRG